MKNAKYNVQTLKFFTFFLYAISAIFSCYYSLYFKSIGLTKQEIGLIIGMGSAIAGIGNPLFSLLSERFQTIKKLLLTSLVFQLGFALLFPHYTNFWPIFLMTSFFSFFFLPSYALADSWAVITMKEQGKNFIGVRLWGSLGFLCLNLLFMQFSHFQNSPNLFWVQIILYSLCILIAIPISDKSSTGDTPHLRDLLTILKDKKVIRFFATVFCMAIVYRINEIYYLLALEELRAEKQMISLSLIISCTAEFTLFWFLSKHGEKRHPLFLLTLSAFLCSLRLLCLGFTTNIYIVLALQLVLGIAFGLQLFTGIHYVTKIIPPEFSVTGIAIYSTIWINLSSPIAGWLGGTIYQHYDAHTLFLCISILALVGMFGYLYCYIKDKKK